MTDLVHVSPIGAARTLCGLDIAHLAAVDDPDRLAERAALDDDAGDACAVCLDLVVTVYGKRWGQR